MAAFKSWLGLRLIIMTGAAQPVMGNRRVITSGLQATHSVDIITVVTSAFRV